MALTVLRFSVNEQTAVTVDKEGLIEIWTTAEHTNSRVKVFEKNGKKLLLSSDRGYTWQHYATKAAYCEYYQLWLGEFPYSSWCIAIRKDSLTNEVDTCILETEINPRGLTQCDRWIAECKSYVSPLVESDLVAV